MEELQNLIAHLKNKGLTDAKISVDVWCGIIEYFANKPEPKQCNIADVNNCADELEPIVGNITATAFTTPNDHGIVTLELRYGHYKMKDWKKGDKLELKHCC